MNDSNKKQLAAQRRLSKQSFKQAEIDRAKAIFGDVEIGNYNLPVAHLSKRGKRILYAIMTPILVFFAYAFFTALVSHR